jgi:hypothetical protein
MIIKLLKMQIISIFVVKLNNLLTYEKDTVFIGGAVYHHFRQL